MIARGDDVWNDRGFGDGSLGIGINCSSLGEDGKKGSW